MKISVSSWSFHRPLYAGSLKFTDVPRAVYDLGIRYMELNDLFLTPIPPSRVARLFGAKSQLTKAPHYGRRTLKAVKQQRLRSRMHLSCWTVETDLSVMSADARSKQRAYIGTAIEAARFLGSPLMRLTMGGEQGDAAAVGRTIDMLRSVVPAATATGVKLAIENHGGLSSEIDSLEEVVHAFRRSGDANHTVGVCLDFKHFAEGQHVEGMTRLAPLALHIHASAHSFDAQGEEASTDFHMSLHAVQDAGYDEAISIEYHGDEEPQEGILKTKALIEKHWHY